MARCVWQGVWHAECLEVCYEEWLEVWYMRNGQRCGVWSV